MKKIIRSLTRYAGMPLMLGLLLSARAEALAPVIFFSDLTSGPNTGGQDGGGAFVTVAGRNFGAGPGTVTVGGGPAAKYVFWSDTAIIFQLGARANSGSIIVTTREGKSNGVPFTVRPGRIYFVGASSPHDPGSGSVADPWRSPATFFNSMQPGDICYFREGNYTGSYGNTDRPYNVSTHNMGTGGTQGNEIAWVGYPRERAVFTAAGSPSGCFEFTTGREYFVVAGLVMYSVGDGRGAVRLFSDNCRIVNCRIEGVKKLSYGMFEVTAKNGTRIWGNECFGATSGNKLDHILYCQQGASNVDFGWNYVHDNDINVGPVISMNEDDGHNSGTVFRDIRIHDNVIDCRNSSEPLRAIGVVDQALGGSAVISNNVFIEAGGNTSWNNAVYLVSGSVSVYNNTFYRSRGEGSSVISIEGPAGNWHAETVEIKNNIFLNQPNCKYISLQTDRANVEISNNCYFGGAGDPPPQDGAAVVADPRFVNAAKLDLHLAAGSPCIGKGANTSAAAPRDLDGVIRVSGEIDIGAYEHVGPAGAREAMGATISGFVRYSDGSGVENVTVSLAGPVSRTAQTEPSGFYQFTGLPLKGNYIVTPGRGDFSFTPVSRSVDTLGGSVATFDFTAKSFYYIKGSVQDERGRRVAGVRVQLSDGVTRTTTTAENGNFTFTGIPGNRNYTIKAVRQGLLFSPVFSTATLSGVINDLVITGIPDDRLPAGGMIVIGSSSGKGTINPGRGDVARIFFRGKAPGRFMLRIFSLSGELLDEETRQDVQEGVFEWHARGMASGVYVAHITGPGISAKKKIAVVK